MEDPSKFFLDNAHIKFSEGTFFSNKAGQFIRMNVACPRSIVNEALDRILAIPEIH
jgi:cystathionine beta-lyase